MEIKINTNPNVGLLVLRLTVAILILFHGVAKARTGIDFLVAGISAYGLPGFLAYFVFVGQIVAPIMLIIGFRSRIAALLVVATMIVAVFMAHSGDFFKLAGPGGWFLELQAFYFLTAVCVFFMGAGKYAISSSSSWD